MLRDLREGALERAADVMLHAQILDVCVRRGHRRVSAMSWVVWCEGVRSMAGDWREGPERMMGVRRRRG